MSQLQIQPTSLDGVLRVKAPVFTDERGQYAVTFNRRDFFEATGVDLDIAQWGTSESMGGVIRGIHAEPWHKLIRVTTGSIYAVIVDLRPTKTYGQLEAFELTRDQMLFVPQGFANSFQAFERTVYDYLVTGYWSRDESYPLINALDSDLAINWPLKHFILSDRDKGHPPFSDHNPALYQQWQERQMALRS